MAIRVVLMDIGGVVVINTATENDFEVMAEKFGSVVGIDPIVLNDVRKQHLREFMTGKFSNAEYFAEVSRISGKSLPDNAEEIWVDLIVPELKVNEPLLQWVDRTRQFCRVVVFSTVSSLRLKLDEKLGIYDRFDDKFLSLDYGVTKYNPEFFHKTIEKLQVSAHEALLIDDQPINVSRANNIGVNGFEYKPYYYTHPESFEAAISVYDFAK